MEAMFERDGRLWVQRTFEVFTGSDESLAILSF